MCVGLPFVGRRFRFVWADISDAGARECGADCKHLYVYTEVRRQRAKRVYVIMQRSSRHSLPLNTRLHPQTAYFLTPVHQSGCCCCCWCRVICSTHFICPSNIYAIQRERARAFALKDRFLHQARWKTTQRALNGGISLVRVSSSIYMRHIFMCDIQRTRAKR